MPVLQVTAEHHHSIRLHGPWQCLAGHHVGTFLFDRRLGVPDILKRSGIEDAGFEPLVLKRTFHWPRIDELDNLSVKFPFEMPLGACKVRLNGEQLLFDDRTMNECVPLIDITQLLRVSNTIEITIDNSGENVSKFLKPSIGPFSLWITELDSGLATDDCPNSVNPKQTP